MRWQEIMAALPYVCPRCSRRFPVEPRKGYCPNHLPGTRVKVLDQGDLVAAFA